MFEEVKTGPEMGRNFPKALIITLAAIAGLWWLFPPGGTDSIVGKELVAASQGAGPGSLDDVNSDVAWVRLQTYKSFHDAVRPVDRKFDKWLAKGGSNGWLEKGDRVRVLEERIVQNPRPSENEPESEDVVRVENLSGSQFGAPEFWVLRKWLIAAPSSAPSAQRPATFAKIRSE